MGNPEDRSPDVTVLGGGVNGVTTALALRSLGYRTEIRTAERADAPRERPPELASLWGAGAVYPHAVTVDGLDAAFADSLAVFRLLAHAATYGVRANRHAWVLEEGSLDPPPGIDPEPMADPPSLGCADADGWRFPLYFAEMPAYLARLYGAYEGAGGRVVRHRVSREELADLPGALLVNCTGYASRDLFDDDRPTTAIRGHLVRVDADLLGGDGPVRSYVYEPAGEDPLYAFPRADGLFLGGSHQDGDPAPGEPWNGETHDGPTTTVGGVEVPERIVTGNERLLDRFGFDVDLRDAATEGMAGYRAARDLDGEGVRLEADDAAGRTVVHNYGHGGAGITLSWGCATRVVRLVRERLSPGGDPPGFTGADEAMRQVRSLLEERA
jgi:D-amino-acid oxidase